MATLHFRASVSIALHERFKNVSHQPRVAQNSRDPRGHAEVYCSYKDVQARQTLSLRVTARWSTACSHYLNDEERPRLADKAEGLGKLLPIRDLWVQKERCKEEERPLGLPFAALKKATYVLQWYKNTAGLKGPPRTVFHGVYAPDRGGRGRRRSRPLILSIWPAPYDRKRSGQTFMQIVDSLTGLINAIAQAKPNTAVFRGVTSSAKHNPVPSVGRLKFSYEKKERGPRQDARRERYRRIN